METNLCTHLKTADRVVLGSYYTPRELVELVHRMISQHVNLGASRDTVILDNAAGSGAFLLNPERHDYRAGDCDPVAADALKKILPDSQVYLRNSLKDVGRGMFDVSKETKLICIGNPPYNDTTSEFRNGEKGRNECDEDLLDRDLGVSFLRSYDKLAADAVCILHPLSYLIKESNFRRLKSFRDNYRLLKGVLFSSALFSQTGHAKFPIVAALYLRAAAGMNYEDVRRFKFDVLGESGQFCLSRFTTTDGVIKKYPPNAGEAKLSPLGLYFYTFRDLNSLRKNIGFMLKPHYNGIVVTLENFYHYAYLFAVKRLFNPKNIWLYGNLSPLVEPVTLEQNKKLFVEYALSVNQALGALDAPRRNAICAHYGVDENLARSPSELEDQICDQLAQLEVRDI